MSFTKTPPTTPGFFKLQPPYGDVTIASLGTDENGLRPAFYFADDSEEAHPGNLAAGGWLFGPKVELEDTLHECKVEWGMYERAALAAMQGDWARRRIGSENNYEEAAKDYRLAAIAFVKVMSSPLPDVYPKEPQE